MGFPDPLPDVRMTQELAVEALRVFGGLVEVFGTCLCAFK
jgi:hypothetical protein